MQVAHPIHKQQDSQSTGQARRRSILVADDDELVLALLQQILAPHYEVQVATSGTAALELAALRPFDIALLDIGMPGLDGIALAGQLQDAFGLPCLFLSASEDVSTVERAADAGAVGYLLKPVDTARLLPALHAAMARADDLRRLRESETKLLQALQAGRETGLAVGILMERHRTDRDTAFRLLRDHARASRRRLDEVAGEIVRSAEVMNALNTRFAEAARRAGREPEARGGSTPA